MPEPVLEIHPEVESDDLVDIASYIAKDNPNAAALLLVEIEQTFHFIASFPEAGTLYHPARKSLSDIRMMPVVAYPNYLVFYKAIQDGSGARILHVLHAARDVATVIRKKPRK